MPAELASWDSLSRRERTLRPYKGRRGTDPCGEEWEGSVPSHFTSFPCLCPHCRPLVRGQLISKANYKAATAKSAQREQSETLPGLGQTPCPPSTYVHRLLSAPPLLPSKFSYFLSPDPGHPCLADDGRAVPHQLVLIWGPVVCCSFTDLPAAQHLHPQSAVCGPWVRALNPNRISLTSLNTRICL